MVTHKDFIIILVTESADRTTSHFFTIAFGNSGINHPMVCFVIKKKITFLFCLNAIHVTVAVFKEANDRCLIANVKQLGKHHLNIGIFQMTDFNSLHTKSVVHRFFLFFFPSQVVSEDAVAMDLARKHKVDIVISSSGLNTLLDNHAPDYRKQWQLPITVQQLEGSVLLYSSS